MYHAYLTEEQRAGLQQQTRDPRLKPRTRDRLEMVRLSDSGWSIPRIARHLRVSEKRVRFWLKRFLQVGFSGLPDQPHPGRQSALTPPMLAGLRQELGKGERTWTAGQLADWLAEHQGLRLSPQWLSRLLGRAKLSYKRTRRQVKHKQDPEQVAERAADLETLERGALKGA